MTAVLAIWYNYLRYGRGGLFVVVIIISAVVRLAKRGRSTNRPSVPQQFQPKQFQPQQFPPGDQQPGYAQPYQQQPGYPPPPPMSAPPAPLSPFAAPHHNPLAPNPLTAPTDRPRSTPLSSFDDDR